MKEQKDTSRVPAQQVQGTATGKDGEIFLHLQDIDIGKDGARRKPKVAHVQALMESIADVGLIHPVCVDRQGKLLAGAHRLNALNMLKKEKLDIFLQLFPGELIPVRQMSVSDQDRGLRIEIAENEKRRDLTRAEVMHVIQKLKDAGYGTKKGGKKAHGDKEHITDALARIMGKSKRTARRVFESLENGSLSKQTDNLPKVTRLLSACRLHIIRYVNYAKSKDNLKTAEPATLSALQHALDAIAKEMEATPHKVTVNGKVKKEKAA